MKHTFLLIIISFFVCESNSQNISLNRFKLDGEIKNCDSGFVILGYINKAGKRISDTGQIKNGKFTFFGEISEPTFATISGVKKIVDFKDINSVDFFIEPIQLLVKLDANNYSDAKLVGSKTNLEFKALIKSLDSLEKKYFLLNRKIIQEKKAYVTARTNHSRLKHEQYTNVLIGRLQKKNIESRKVIIKFIKHHPNSYVSPYFFYSLANQLPLDSAKKIYYSFSENIQNSSNGLFIKELFQQKEKNKIGNQAYNFMTFDYENQKVELNQFKGKYLYIDFWASWCIPCREQFPKLKNLYYKYKSKGFEVLTVSIDKDTIQWRRAIVKDGLNIWSNISVSKEIEDNYDNVNNPIPSGLLINPDGKIVWKTGTSDRLEDVLKRIIK
ncbi:redoxin domain-containing protein [Sediminibacterium sp.]|uniref:redoxin domain-containing protein n=1 Tax=Sediminibacterium sp. TaxID=1917865 RepID=UPI003F6FD741